MTSISILKNPFKIGEGSEFSKVFEVAVTNAHNAGKRTVTPMDVKRVVQYRLNHHELTPEARQELARMATLRGVIDNSSDVFARNGQLTDKGKSIVDSKMSFLESFARFYSACFKGSRRILPFFESGDVGNKPRIIKPDSVIGSAIKYYA